MLIVKLFQVDQQSLQRRGRRVASAGHGPSSQTAVWNVDVGDVVDVAQQIERTRPALAERRTGQQPDAALCGVVDVEQRPADEFGEC